MSKKLIADLENKLSDERKQKEYYIKLYYESYIDINALCCMCEICGNITYRIHTEIFAFINADSIRICYQCSTELKRNLIIENAEKGTYMFDYESDNPTITWRINKGFNKVHLDRRPIQYAKLRDSGNPKAFILKPEKKALEK